jgi:F0F1-type ATP synthase membrane subunit b/b'
MLDWNFVQTLLQTSITGAGLVLAVYALIIPLYKKIFNYRAESIYEDLQDLKEAIRETDTRVSQEKLDELKESLENIEAHREFPSYLGWIVGASFFLYLASTLMSVWWILDWNRATFDSWLPYAFGISTILFITIGIYAIKDISQTMKKEFEDLKEEVEEAKSQAKEKKR